MIIGIAKAVAITVTTMVAVVVTTITIMVVAVTTITTVAAAATTITTMAAAATMVAVVTKQNAKGQSKDCLFIYHANNGNCSITQN